MRMLSMRKGLALTIAATVAVLAGCSGSKPQETANPASNGSAPAVSTTKIKFYHAMDPKTAQGKVLQDLVKQFNDSQKEVAVEDVYQAGSYAGVDKAVSNDIQAGGAVPAVIQASDSGLTNYVDANALVDVESFIADDKADLLQSVLGPLTFNGKLYAVPFNKSMLVTIYDKTVIKTAPKNWDEFKAMAKEATVKDKKFGTVVEPTNFFFGQFMVQAGGEWLTKDGKAAFNSDAGVQSMQYLADLVKDGSATILKQGEFSSNLFNEGRVAMILTTSASYAHITKPADQWAAAPLIAGPKNDMVPFSGANFAILKQAKPEEQKAAGTFIKFMISKDAQVKWAVGETGYMPVRKSALDTKEWKDFVAAKPNYKVFETSFSKGTVQPNVKVWASVQKEINAAMDSILLGQKDPKSGLDAAATKANDLLAKK